MPPCGPRPDFATGCARQAQGCKEGQTLFIARRRRGAEKIKTKKLAARRAENHVALIVLSASGFNRRSRNTYGFLGAPASLRDALV